MARKRKSIRKRLSFRKYYHKTSKQAQHAPVVINASAGDPINQVDEVNNGINSGLQDETGLVHLTRNIKTNAPSPGIRAAETNVVSGHQGISSTVTVVDDVEHITFDSSTNYVMIPNDGVAENVAVVLPQAYLDNSESIALICPTVPQASPLAAEANDLNSLWRDVTKLVEGLIPSNYQTCVEEDCLTVMILSKGENKVIQRSAVFQSDGVVKVFVHGKPLRKDHIFWKNVAPFPSLSSVPANAMCDIVINFLIKLRQFQVCIGIPEEHLLSFSKSKEGCYIEEGFQEFRYSKTLRPDECFYLVSQNSKRCCKCSVWFKRTNEQYKRLSNAVKATAAKCKPDSYSWRLTASGEWVLESEDPSVP